MWGSADYGFILAFSCHYPLDTNICHCLSEKLYFPVAPEWTKERKVQQKYVSYERSRIATCLWCANCCMCEVYVCLCQGLCLAKGIRVILWFFFWLYNSHLTAEIVQGRIRDSRPPPFSHSAFFLSYLSYFNCNLELQFPLLSRLQKAFGFTFSLLAFLCVSADLEFLTLYVWWLRCKTQMGQTRAGESRMD